MALALLEVYHSRPATPVRRVAIGMSTLPVEPAPGHGGILLGAVVAAHLPQVDPALVGDVEALITEISEGRRIPQPRLRHRLEVARHGLARSTHRLHALNGGGPGNLSFHLECNGTPLQQVLGAVYALNRLPRTARTPVADTLLRAIRWHGPIGPGLVSFLGGRGLSALGSAPIDADPVGWALAVLGITTGNGSPTPRQVQAHFRSRLVEVHPDTGGDPGEASRRIAELGEARRILLA